MTWPSDPVLRSAPLLASSKTCRSRTIALCGICKLVSKEWASSFFSRARREWEFACVRTKRLEQLSHERKNECTAVNWGTLVDQTTGGGPVDRGALWPTTARAQTEPKMKMKMTTDIPAGIASPDKVETRLGTLKFFDGFPDQASVEKLYDNLDFQRAVQAYLLAFPPASYWRNCDRWGSPGPSC